MYANNLKIGELYWLLKPTSIYSILNFQTFLNGRADSYENYRLYRLAQKKQDNLLASLNITRSTPVMLIKHQTDGYYAEYAYCMHANIIFQTKKTNILPFYMPVDY
jgi:hypothetical protein